MSRYLTTSERMFLAMADEVVMNPVVMVRCRGSLPVERVVHAIRTVQRRHPALQTRVVADAPPWFSSRDVPEVPLRVVERRSDAHWRELVVEELNLPLPIERGPLIRFVLVRDEQACELICTTDHVNADGRSGLFVLRDVLRVIEQPSLRLVPLRERSSFDDYLPSGAWDLRMPDALRGVVAARTRELLRRRADTPERSTEPRERAPIELVHRRYDAARTAELVATCRAHDNTVLSALIVACSQALAGGLGHTHALIGCITPIDIRAMLSPSVGDDFGIYAWAPTSHHAIAPNADFWRLAARARRIVRAYRSMPALAGMRHLLDVVEYVEDTPLADTWNRANRRLLDGLMVVSNLGQVSLPERAAGVEIESFGFFAMIPDVDFVLGVQSFRGVLELDYCWSPRWATRSLIEDVAARVEATLDAAIGLHPA